MGLEVGFVFVVDWELFFNHFFYRIFKLDVVVFFHYYSSCRYCANTL